MPLYTIILREKHSPHRTLDCGQHRGASAQHAINAAKNKLKGMTHRLELGDSAWAWEAHETKR